MKLIVGLGNPGVRYSRNRHNIGFMCLSRFARKHGIRFTRKHSQARVGEGEVASTKLILARPQTMMNLSGNSVSRLVERYKTEPEDLIVIHDDLDLPLGKIRLRQGGRSAGHKGIESIIACLGNGDFIRIRVGIGRPDDVESEVADRDAGVIDHVLSDFDTAESRTVAKAMNQVCQAITCLLSEGLTAVMNKYN